MTAMSPGAASQLEQVRANYAKAGENLGSVTRPSDVAPGAFGLKIKGDCLAPRARDGQIVIVEKVLPEPGELAVVWLKGAKGPAIKILSREILGFPVHPESECVPALNLEQLNPPAHYSVWLDKVECIARARVISDADDGRRRKRTRRLAPPTQRA